MKYLKFFGWAALSLCAVLGGPASGKKKPKVEAPPPVAADMQVEGIVGELDDGAVQRVLQANHGATRRCYDEQAGRLHYVGGHLELKVRVLPSGKPKWVAIIDSSLGNSEVEQCVVSTLEKLQFPAPKGGEGELTCPIDFAARTPTGNWQKERISSVLAKKKAALSACKGKTGTAAVKALRMTLYVGPGGTATSAGFAADEPQDPKLAKCVADRVLALQYDDPLGQMVKVSFPIGDLFGSNP